MLHTFQKVAVWSLVAAAGVVANAADEVRETTTTKTTKREVQRVSTLMDSKILIQNDKNVGKVADFVFSDSGCVEYVVASYEDQYYVIPYSAAEVRYSDQVVFVDIDQAQFDKIEYFSSNNWPDLYSSSYRDTVFANFNVTSIRVDASDDDRRDSRRGRDGDRRDRADDRRDRRDSDSATTRDRETTRDSNTTTNRNRETNRDSDANRDRNDRDRPAANEGNRDSNRKNSGSKNSGNSGAASGDRPREGANADDNKGDREKLDKEKPTPRSESGNNPGRSEGSAGKKESGNSGSGNNPGKSEGSSGKNESGNSGNSGSSKSDPKPRSEGGVPRNPAAPKSGNSPQ